jgi:mRNA-degrading endonuclease RelE of RelBE toxin-antitoxin system
MNYTVRMGRNALAALYKIERGEVAEVTQTIGSLRRNPRPSGARGIDERPGTFTVSTGGHVVIYEIDDSRREVLVIFVG